MPEQICPPASVPGHDGLEGCGSENVVGPDHEGLYDCLDCGLWWENHHA